jgi:hypothetical protein
LQTDTAARSVSEWTLRAAFQEYFRVNSVRNLNGRALNLVRRSATNSDTSLATVTKNRNLISIRQLKGGHNVPASLQAKLMTAMASAKTGDTTRALQLEQELREKYPLNSLCATAICRRFRLRFTCNKASLISPSQRSCERFLMSWAGLNNLALM